MLLGSKGQNCKTIEQAELYIKEFIRETITEEFGPMKRHSGEYDLYLPWLQEEVFTAPRACSEAPKFPDLDVLFMDATWSLVAKGYLRPGPHRMSSIISPSDYGRGYSLTPAGRTWVRE